MASNLTFIANFVDTNRPVVAITAPTANQRWSNAVFTVKGTAGDNLGLASVQYQLNSAAWSAATPGVNWSNWTAVMNLTPGTNTVRAYALDVTGNRSPTNSVSFVCVWSATISRAGLAAPADIRLDPAAVQNITRNGFRLELHALPGVIGRFEVSSNLVGWIPLAGFTATPTPLQIRDQSATNFNWRFYRVIVP